MRIMSALAVRARTARRPTGTIMAPPAPWSTRITTSSEKLALPAHSSDARVKMTMAARNTLRVPSEATIHPLRGISTARVIR